MQAIHQGELHVHLRTQRGILLLFLQAPWCPVCRQVRKHLEALEKRYPQVLFLEADADNSPALMTSFMVEMLPLVMVYNGGKVLYSREGYIGELELEQKIKGERR